MKKRLFTPGPTEVPPEVLLEMARPIIHHRTPQFSEIFKEVGEGLKNLFQTKNEVFTFASSGTGAMESAVSILLSPGEKALFVSGGKFGERFGEICSAYGIEATPIKVEYGRSVEPSQIREILEKEKGIKVLFTTLCETSTGAATDIREIAQITKDLDVVQVVDAISSLGAVECRQDEWGIDVILSSSQKAFMLPPGLSFISLSEKAWERVERAKLPHYYFDLKKHKESLKKASTPFTPAVSLIIGLNKALSLIKEETLENVWKRHALLANACREAMKGLGLELLTEKPSSVLTAVKVPEGVDGNELVKSLRDKYGISFAGGQSSLKGKIFRLAHLGYIDRFDLILAISALEKVLLELDYKFELGSGIKAAEKVLF